MKIDITHIIEAVKEAGDFAKKSFNSAIYQDSESTFTDVREKSKNELVLQEDLACEKIIISKIKEHNPNAVIYSEESSNISELNDDKNQIKYLIDPLDGTHNYFFGLPFWGICVAILNNKNVSIASVIYIPMMNILLKCEGVSKPSFIYYDNSWKKVNVKPRLIDKSLVCYDNQFYKLGSKAIERYNRISQKCFTTRITGSAVCDAALIATGKINARIWNKTNAYDIAAGMLIVKGAGGLISDLQGNNVNALSKQILMCSDKELQGQLVSLI
jgi:myo-inositol-1(or 4)-monophosphatase